MNKTPEEQKNLNKKPDPNEGQLKSSDTTDASEQPAKPPKPEEKPFELFINEDFIPSLKKALQSHGYQSPDIVLVEGDRPVVGGKCWMVKGEIFNRRRFWLCFSSNEIKSQKTIVLAEPGSEPSLLESFLIDEKKATLALLVSRLLQRLNGQKWLGAN